MLRRIVTLLALLSGLTVFGAPAQAALTQVLGSQAEASQPCEETRSAEAVAMVRRSSGNFALRTPLERRAAGHVVDVTVPTVRFGIDRAFE